MVRARRALWVLGRASTSQIVEWTHPRSPRHVQHSPRAARRARNPERVGAALRSEGRSCGSWKAADARV